MAEARNPSYSRQSALMPIHLREESFPELYPNAAHTPTRPHGRRRDRALMGTMLRGGFRCAEMSSLRPRDIDWDGNRMRVMGKGSKERLVPLDPVLKAWMLEWKARRPRSPWFF